MANQYGQIVGDFANKNKLSGAVVPHGQIGGSVDRAATSYEKNYEILDNKPSINTHVLSGDQTGNELGLVDGENQIEFSELDRMFNTVFGA